MSISTSPYSLSNVVHAISRGEGKYEQIFSAADTISVAWTCANCSARLTRITHAEKQNYLHWYHEE